MGEHLRGLVAGFWLGTLLLVVVPLACWGALRGLRWLWRWSYRMERGR